MTWKLDDEHKPNHTSYALYFHVTWSTKKREPLVSREIADFLETFFPHKCEELEVHLLAQGVVCDHVHLILSLRPTHYIPEVLNYLKGTAAHEANNHHNFINTLAWTRGYHIDTISKRNLDAAKAYVNDQYKRHPDKIPV